MKIVYGLCIVLGAFFGTLWFMDRLDAACPVGKVTVLKKPFQPRGGSAYAAADTTFASVSDFSDTPTRSTIVLCEGDTRLGPAHTAHADVSSKGGGRYSHWASSFVFSASDNSDPNKNGRTYLAVQPGG